MVRQVVSGTLHHSVHQGSPRYERYSHSSGEEEEEESKVRDGGLGR